MIPFKEFEMELAIWLTKENPKPKTRPENNTAAELFQIEEDRWKTEYYLPLPTLYNVMQSKSNTECKPYGEKGETADMGVGGSSRIDFLLGRKQILEDTIRQKTEALKILCMKEADLTGQMPTEIPLAPGEPVPTVRRRVGTAYEYPQTVLTKSTNENEMMKKLQMEIQVQRRIGEAALKVAGDPGANKSVKRKNLIVCNQSKQTLLILEDRLNNLKALAALESAAGTGAIQQPQPCTLKHKKKPRPPLDNDKSHDETNVTYCGTGYDTIPDSNIRRQEHREEQLVATMKQMNLNNSPTSSMFSQPAVIPQHLRCQPAAVHHGGISGNRLSPSHPILPLNSSPFQQNNPAYSQTLQHPIVRNRAQMGDARKFSTIETQRPIYSEHQRNVPQPSPQQFALLEATKQYLYDPYHQQTNNNPTPSNIYTPQRSPGIIGQPVITPNVQLRNPPPVSTPPCATSSTPPQHDLGLGGHWMKSDNGRMIWVPVQSPMETTSNWQQERRFASLDRRREIKQSAPGYSSRGRAITKRMTIPEPARQAQQPLQTVIRSTPGRHNCQLVRAQSLGSVGLQTIDNTWPSDDNSSYDSDSHSINMGSRKIKQKDWYETSLDGPSEIILQNAQIPNPLTIQDDNFSVQSINTSRTSLPSPQTPKPMLEIPAESNPSPMISENNLEMYNNNVLSDLPKNCTVVQAGVCKPYREVTKPFEMSDFYKYSTKFRERKEKPARHDPEWPVSPNYNNRKDISYQRSSQNFDGNDDVDGADIVQKIYQPLQPLKCQPYSSPVNNGNMNRSYMNALSPDMENTSMDSTLALSPNVAENFSAEMNAWYQSHGHMPVKSTSSSPSVGRTGATLV